MPKISKMKNKIILAIITFALVFLVVIIFHLINIYSRTSRCGIENCHGLDIKCGPNIPNACTMEYQIGDRCREYAKCEIINGKCQLTQNIKFQHCKSCVEKCVKNFKDNIQKQFDCEENCIN